MSGGKNLTLEQALDLTEFMSMSFEEGEYFLLLVELDRAGTTKLKKRIRTRIETLKNELKSISKIAPNDLELKEETKAQYYSDWIFSAVRLFLAADEDHSLDHIAQKLRCEKSEIQRALLFLKKNKFIEPSASGAYSLTKANLHLPAESPFSSLHHKNWRLKGFEFMKRSQAENLFYTAPMAVSREAAQMVRERLPQFISQIVNPNSSQAKVYWLVGASL